METTQLGPFGATTATAEFETLPPETLAEPRIKAVTVEHAWAIGTLYVQYEDSAAGPVALDTSQPGSLFEIPAGDDLVAVSGGWGRQAAGYPKDEIITLQLETAKGLQSPLYGGGSGSYEVESFEFRAGEGEQIVGLFGARGGRQNLPQRLGVYLAAAPAVKIVVTHTEDSGPGSLRQAILDANAAGRPALIRFDVGGGGEQTITPRQVLPTVTGSVSIDGTTQPGFAGEPLIRIRFEEKGLILRNLKNATLEALDLSWDGDAPKGTGLRADGCANLTIRNLRVANREHGVVVVTSTDVKVLDNDLRSSGNGGDRFALYLHTLKAEELPGGVEVRGNRFGDADGALFLNEMKDLVISDGSVADSNVVLDRGGFESMSGTWDVLDFRKLEDATIAHLDLSYGGESPEGVALRLTRGSKLTVRDLTTANRNYGIVVIEATDVKVLDNDLRRSGYGGDRFALFLHTLAAGELRGGVEVRGNCFGDADGAVFLESMKDLVISDGSVADSNVVLDQGGFESMTGTWDVLDFRRLENATIASLDLSYGGESPEGVALRLTRGSNLTARDLTTANRNYGIIAIKAMDVRILDNDLRHSGYGGNRFALFLHTLAAGELRGGVEVRGNRFGDADGAVFLESMKGLVISDGSVADSNVVLDQGGFESMTGTWDVLDFRRLENATIASLDLSYGGESPEGVALRLTRGTNLTARDLTTANRNYGIIVAEITDVRVLDNDLRHSGYGGNRFALFLHTLAAGELRGGVEVRGNRFGDADGAVFLESMKDLVISDGSVADSNVVLDQGGFETMTGTWDVLDFRKLENATIENLDLSRGGDQPQGVGLKITKSSGVTVRQLVAENRVRGVVISGTSDAQVVGLRS